MRFSGGLKTALFVLVLALALFQIGSLAVGVAQQVDRLSKANSGDGLWHLSQVEVDYRRLTTALATAEEPVGYAEVRHRFDVLYSRVLTLREGDSYAVHRSQAAFLQNLSNVIEFLDTALPYIDGTDQLLAQELDKLIAKTNSIDGSVRQLALAGVLNSTQRNESLRNDTRDILLRLFATTMGLIAGLVLLVIVLRRMYRQTRRVSEDNKLARARIASMIHASLDAILVTDPKGQLLEMNRAAQRMFQIYETDEEQRFLSDLVKGTEGAGDFDNPARSGLLAKGRVQTQAKRLDGSQFPVEISLMQAKLEQRSDIYVAYVRDISARLSAEDKLRRARDEAQAGEKAKTRLLAVMSHEIRTPLNGVLGAADLLSRTELDETQERYVGAMQTSGGILERHINDVLELSRLDDAQQQRQLAPIDLHQLVPEIVESQRAYAEQAETQLDIRVFKNVPTSVLGDKLALQQVLLNLVGNAIKFTTGGNVCVEVDHFGQGNFIEFRVIDDGIGISEGELSKVFDDFYAIDTSYARRKQGTGLGLGITKRIITALGGDIGAESIPEEGSLFWFRLPMEPVNAVVLRHGDKEQVIQAARPSNILLVEDNAINRMIASDMLQNAGHRVTQAENGVDGVAAAEQTKFDLILMDISMPEMDGLTAAKLIRDTDGQSKDTPIIALTAQSMATQSDELATHGISQVLQKPLTSAALNSALEAALAGEGTVDWSAIPSVTGKVLDTEILQDVLANIGLEKTRRHFEELTQEMSIFTEQEKLEVNGVHPDIPTAHHLAGAAAVLGLCALHKKLSALDEQEAEARDASTVLQEWETASAAFDRYIESFSSQRH